MIVPATIASAVSVLVLSLAGSSTRNVIETIRLSRADISGSCEVNAFQPGSSSKATVENLQSLKRKELLELFFAGDKIADLSEIEGEWNGFLLDNGTVLTRVSSILSNVFFGKGKKWYGKSFMPNNVGVNRFISDDGIVKNHSFDYSIVDCSLGSDGESVRLDYSKYQTALSPWKSMVDEVRFINGDHQVLIGLGSLGWSGGMMNPSPFCLWRTDNDTSKPTETKQ